jgi:hypothetical protein
MTLFITIEFYLSIENQTQMLNSKLCHLDSKPTINSYPSVQHNYQYQTQLRATTTITAKR